MDEEWVDHSLDMARKAEKGQKAIEKARAEAKKKLKETPRLAILGGEGSAEC